MKMKRVTVGRGETGSRYRCRGSRLVEVEIVKDDFPPGGMYDCQVRILEGPDRGMVVGARKSELLN